MLVRFLGRLGFRDLVVLVNTVGDVASRAAYRDALRAHLAAARRDELGEDSPPPARDQPAAHPRHQVASTSERSLANAPRLAEYLSDREPRALRRRARRSLERYGVRVRGRRTPGARARLLHAHRVRDLRRRPRRAGRDRRRRPLRRPRRGAGWAERARDRVRHRRGSPDRDAARGAVRDRPTARAAHRRDPGRGRTGRGAGAPRGAARRRREGGGRSSTGARCARRCSAPAGGGATWC